MRALRARAQIHSLRDHPNHDRPLNGGMWGGVKGAVPEMAALVGAWSNKRHYMGDLDFLNKKARAAFKLPSNPRPGVPS